MAAEEVAEAEAGAAAAATELAVAELAAVEFAQRVPARSCSRLALVFLKAVSVGDAARCLKLEPEIERRNFPPVEVRFSLRSGTCHTGAERPSWEAGYFPPAAGHHN